MTGGDAPGQRTGFDRGVGSVADVIRLGVRPFAAPAGQPRTRRATDVVVLVPALLVLPLLVAAYPPSSLELALIRLLAVLPAWLDPVWGFFTDLAWLWALAVFTATVIGRRFSVAGQALAALVVAAAIGIVSARIATSSWTDVVDAVLGRANSPDFPDVRLAAAVAAVGTVSPHLVKPLRTTGRWVIALGVVGAAVIATGTPGGALAALLIGLAAASVVNLAVGTSAGRPGLDDVVAGLAQLGVRVEGPEQEERQVAGVLRVRATSPDGRPLLVKVYGRDAADNQLVARLWRRVWYRRSGPAIGSSRLHGAEREAFVTLLVRKAGVPTRDVVTAGATLDDDALLVLAGEAVPLASLDPSQIDDRALHDAWEVLGHLGELRIAHQQIDPSTVAVVEGRIGFVDFGGATVAPDEHHLGVDRAQLLATTAALAGPPRALDGAVAGIGARGVASLLPYLQAAAFTPPLRRALKDAGVDVDDLRRQAAETVGAEPPDLVSLRRVTLRSGVQIALLSLATYAILSAATDVDWEELRATVDDAAWAWIVFAFLVAQLPRVTQAVSTLGSVPAALPFGPVYAMQLATGYMNVALPSNLARMAVNIRFFQRQGLPPPTAVASGAIDSFASTVIQAVLLGLLLLFSESSLSLELPFPSGGARTALWIVVALVLVSVLTLTLVGRFRRPVIEQARRWWPDVRDALGALRASNKLALLVLGSLATEILFALALGLFARSFGYDLTLTELLVVNMSVSLLGSFVPVPGNIGVAELGLTIGLVSAGMTDESALAAVLLYRISTYYLPPVWGFVALRRLQRDSYL